MKRLCILILSIVVTFSVPMVGTTREIPVFHGFSDSMELVMCVDSELMWLVPDNDVPSFSIPATKVFYNPGSDYIYLSIDNQMIFTDYNHEILQPIDFVFENILNTQAQKCVLLVNDKNGSHVFCGGEHVFSRPYLINIESVEDNFCLLSKDGDTGAIVFDILNQDIIGESDFGIEYQFIDDKIVCLQKDYRYVHFCSTELEITNTLPGTGEYYLKDGYIYKKASEKEYIIDPTDVDLYKELPKFKNSFSNNDILVGLSEENSLSTLKLPSLEVKTSNLEIPQTDDWMWFKSYDNRILASIGSQGVVIDSNGSTIFTDCKPISSLDNLVLCSTDGTNCLFDANTGKSISISSEIECLSIVSKSGNECIILVGQQEKKQLARVNVLTGELVVLRDVDSLIYTVGTPHTNSLSDISSTYDAGSINKLREDGFFHSATLYVDHINTEKLILFDSNSLSYIKYISPVPLR